MEIEQIKQFIQENESIYRDLPQFKLDIVPPEDVLESPLAFLKWFIKEANAKSYCQYVSNNEVQCEPGKNRSTRDLFILTSHYIPSTTLEDVILALVELNETRQIETLQCPNISARVWYNVESKGAPSSIISSYDLMGKNHDTPRIEQLTDNLNYGHLKSFYEHTNKEETVASKAVC